MRFITTGGSTWLARSCIRFVWCPSNGVNLSIPATGRGIVGGNLNSLSFVDESTFPLIAGSLIATGNEGPITANLGGHGATVENNVSGESHRGVFCVWERKAIATLCLDIVEGGGDAGGR